jgi:hypothetical protein
VCKNSVRGWVIELDQGIFHSLMSWLLEGLTDTMFIQLLRRVPLTRFWIKKHAACIEMHLMQSIHKFLICCKFVNEIGYIGGLQVVCRNIFMHLQLTRWAWRSNPQPGPQARCICLHFYLVTVGVDGIFVHLSQQMAANILEMFRFDLHWQPL